MPGSGYPPTASSVSRFVMKQNTAGQSVSTASSVSTAASGTGYGSWVQVTASTSVENYIVGVCLDLDNVSGDQADGPILVDVGRGAAASEVTLATIPCGVASLTTGTAYQWMGEAILPAPIRVATSSRIAVRLARFRSGSTSALTGSVGVYFVPYLSVEGN
jgi:hypothetical protein